MSHPSVKVDLRPATGADLPAIAKADGRAFGVHYSAQDLDAFAALFDPDRFLLATDPEDGSVLGATGSFPFDVTMPGGGTLPAPGVTWVSVAATHRRRGILRALMTEQHRDFVDGGAAVSLLTASEGGIYGRFGYGVATTHRAVEITRNRAVFRPDAADPGGVRQVDTAELREIAPAVHRRWAADTPAVLARNDAWWDVLTRDPESHRHGGTALFHLAHPDGYASYRFVHGEHSLRIDDMAAATDEAHAALWRVLLAHDLVEKIISPSLPVDDPLPFLLTDPRQVRTTGWDDGMWARVLDVPAALAARRYAVELDVVLDVHDPFVDRGGRFRLRGGPDGSTCEPTGPGGPTVAIRVAALGSLLFGGQRVGPLVRTGLMEAEDPAALQRLDRAFLADRAPQHGTQF